MTDSNLTKPAEYIMKDYIKKAAMMITLLMAVTLNAAAGNEKPISVSQMPHNAQQLLSRHFSNKKVALAKVESGFFSKEYTVIFTNGEKIEFDSNGNWTEISCKRSAVPASIVPPQISSYVKKNYPGCIIIKIERDDKEYEIDLSNRIEITFNKKFQVIDIE